MEHVLAGLLSRFTYLAIIGLLSAAGLGVPISEDLVLLLGGALAARGVTSFWPTLATGYFGVVLGDCLIHRWGMRMGPAAYRQKKVQKVLSPERQEQLRVHFERHGFLTVVIARHTPVLRPVVFFLAGASDVPFWKFLLADALSSAVTVPVVVSLGYYFGEHLDEILKTIRELEWTIAGLLAVVALLWFWWRHRRGQSSAV